MIGNIVIWRFHFDQVATIGSALYYLLNYWGELGGTLEAMISKHLIAAKRILWYFLYNLFILKACLFIYLTIKVIKGKGARCVEYFTCKRPGGLCTPLDIILALLNTEENSSK